MTPESTSGNVRETLSGPGLHAQWRDDYRTAASDRFYDAAVDRIVGMIEPPPGSTLLDAGCGVGMDTIRLARRGYRVVGMDFSESALGIARQNILSAGMADRVELRAEDLTALSFPDASFSYILCWGVLMHIPEVEKALSELVRVLKPGGALVLSEINVRSAQRVVFRAIQRLRGKGGAGIRKTPAGVEHWFTTPDGELVVRHTDMDWLVSALEQRGLALRKRTAGEFTELYLKTSSPLMKRFIHGFNLFWFRAVRNPHLAFGNILVFEKPVQG